MTCWGSKPCDLACSAVICPVQFEGMPAPAKISSLALLVAAVEPLFGEALLPCAPAVLSSGFPS